MKDFPSRRNFLKKAAYTLPIAFTYEDSLIKESPTWVKLDNTIYGAKPNELGPIGGGKGYTKVVTTGEYIVDSFEGLADALQKVKSGETIWIKDETEIDMTADIYIHDFFFEIPAGVTIAGNRGYKGSQGPILTSDALKTPFMLKVAGAGVRITGLRLRGPNSKRYMRHHGRAFGSEKLGPTYYYKFPTSNGIKCDFDNLEVDNCEISAFGAAGISLSAGTNHHVHHNYIHHCQYHGLGYGISHNRSSSVIEYNLFNYNRHSIAGTGAAVSEYIARHNVEVGVSSSHCFDMHGGRDRKDNTNIAGKKIEIYNNTFFVPDQLGLLVRGEPVEYCKVYQNWFPFKDKITSAVKGEQRTEIYNNLFEQGRKKIVL